MMLLADAIRMHAVDEPEKIAICDDSRQISYDELHHGMMAAVNELLANEEDFEAGGLPW